MLLLLQHSTRINRGGLTLRILVADTRIGILAVYPPLCVNTSLSSLLKVKTNFLLKTPLKCSNTHLTWGIRECLDDLTFAGFCCRPSLIGFEGSTPDAARDEELKFLNSKPWHTIMVDI